MTGCRRRSPAYRGQAGASTRPRRRDRRRPHEGHDDSVHLLQGVRYAEPGRPPAPPPAFSARDGPSLRHTRATRTAGSGAACARPGSPGSAAGRNPRKSAAGSAPASWQAAACASWPAIACPHAGIGAVETRDSQKKFRRAAAPEKSPPADRAMPAAPSLRPRGRCARCLGGAAGSAPGPGPRPLPCQHFVHIGKMRAARDH